MSVQRWIVQQEACSPEDVASLLSTVPEWFGRPESNREYADAAATKEAWIVRSDNTVIGVTMVDRHVPHVAEIYLTSVDREFQGAGVGTAMLTAIEHHVRGEGVHLLEVKTLGPSDPDENYARTRYFHEKCGFFPMEETYLWDDDTPCLIRVKPLHSA